MQSDEQVEKFKAVHQFTAYKGELEYDEEGNILNEVEYVSPEYENMIVTSGKNLTLDRLFGLNGPPAAVGFVGVGDSATAAALAQAGLLGANVLIKAADGGTARNNQTVNIKATFGTGEANFNWNEAGLFNGNVNGTSIMFNRVVIGPFNKTPAVSIVYSTNITQQ